MKFIPIYPNYKQSDTTFEISNETGQKKVISIHDRIANIALSKITNNLTNF